MAYTFIPAALATTALAVWPLHAALADANGDVESRVREFFADAPIMADIAKCESEFRQYGENGALHGGMGNKMVGVFQIFSDIHAEYAATLGYDIYSLDGNLGYARHLYEREGTRPWLSSSSCWKNRPASAGVVTTSVTVAVDPEAITTDLAFGMSHPQVRTLQKRLNVLGYTVAPEGPGAPGSETTVFGSRTRDAVRHFQCARGIVCEGDEYSTGYGRVGPQTRAALAAPGAADATEGAPASPPTDSGDQAAEIARLQARIAELTRVLEALRAR